jgi:pilus assembly protein CpaC
MRTLSVVLTFVLLICSDTFAADEWKEIGVSNKTQGHGDRVYMAKYSDTLKTIARQHTGSEDNWQAIASYNQLSHADSLSDRMLLIPESLLKDSKPKQQFQIQEFKDTTPAPVSAAEEQKITDGLASVKTVNVDLFSGQVEVLAKVDVKRVAVGNGSIIRAEVLKTGELLVIAQAPGSTSLRLWHKSGKQTDFNIRVSEHDPETRFPMERMVRMKVKMVEFRKSALGKLGIDWADSIAGPTLATAGDVIGNNLFRPAAEGFAGLPNTVRPFSTYFGIASNITSRINFMASNGDAMTLAEPILSCANGGSASFLAGGEVPYPTINSQGQSQVEFKEYGIKLNISPQIDPVGNVRTTVETEISQLDPALSVAGTPGLLTRKAQTQVNVRSGETIVISGLLSSEMSKDADHIPGLGKLPVLGSLFGSKNIRNSVTELVIFVTPEVIEPSANKLTERDSVIHEYSRNELNKARSSIPLLD